MASDEEFKLCFVDRMFAYFTTQDIHEQCADDWDDSHYAHNAGEPYHWSASSGVPPYRIQRFPYTPGPKVRTPTDFALVEHLSVRQINARKAPWFSTGCPRVDGTSSGMNLWAGASIESFRRYMYGTGGAVYKVWEWS